MTGQVKEDIISRFREIGIKIISGKILFNPSMLKRKEFLEKEEIFTYYDLRSKQQKINCKKNSFAFTYCQVPFSFIISKASKITVHLQNDELININGLDLGESLSQSIFSREGKVRQVEVFFNKLFDE
jgi:hypothetical protein